MDKFSAVITHRNDNDMIERIYKKFVHYNCACADYRSYEATWSVANEA